MAAEVTTISTENFDPQGYSGQDFNLISSQEINTSFDTGSYIELNVYNLNNELLINDNSFSQYTILNDGQSALTDEITQIIINPEEVLETYGYDQGVYITYFNFFNKQIGTNTNPLYISEISSDRTEIRLDSNTLSNPDIVEQTLQFVQKRENSTYFLDFYVNFGDNQLYVANNIKLDNKDPQNPTILVKLYNPLPLEFDLKDNLWIVTILEESRAYQVEFEDEIIEADDDTITISGPNFNLDIKDQVNNSTGLLSYTDLLNTTSTSSLDQINNLLNRTEIDLNVDYTQFSEFIHFSSAQTRLENFYYKVGLIESYSSSIAILDNTTSSADTSGSKAVYESKISNIIKNFDGYDYFLYYDSSSYAWPKTNSQKPYLLAKRDSTEVNSWFGSVNELSPLYGGLILSASLYDNENKDNLKFSIPEYLRDDPDNAQYELFVDMVAQHYDNIWIYHKELTQKYDADNRLEYGISKDIVADAIRDFGVKLYQNNFSNDDLYTAFLGLTPDGGLFPFPNITGSLPTPSGFEYIDQFISASTDVIPLDDVNKSLYKRIYHNIPYLLKAKGTIPGLRALITSYGIPDTILRINEFGGKDKINVNDWDHWQREFNYAFSTTGSNFITSSWELNSEWDSPVANNSPATVMFRFKPGTLPTSSINYSQSIWHGGGGGAFDGFALTLRYTGSAYTSASYSGSIIDPYYQYANLDFYPDMGSTAQTASVYLPFYDGGWWTVMVTKNLSTFTLYAQNKIYEGGDNGTQIGFTASNSTTSGVGPWQNTTQVYFPATSSILSTYTPFSGSYQEIRYYAPIISESVLKDYTMNPHSIEGNSTNTSPNELAFRASLGGELYTGSTSIHPKVTGSWVTTHSFASDSDFYFDTTPTFLPNTEYFFADQPVAGLRNIIKDKIRIENNVIPEGDTLSPFMSLSQMSNVSQSYTPGINYLEVAFSPQNEINEDIMDQIGYFNIGEYIGDPRQRSSSAVTYPDLDNLRNDYFEKYTKNYNLTDFIRLIKFFDNSLFKMIRDFVPARTSLASGVVVKQHLLERNKYPQPQMSYENKIYTGSIDMVAITGGAAGVFNEFNGLTNRFGITQSYSESIETISGSVLRIHDNQEEFYNGEFSGSNLVVTTQSLAQEYALDFQGFEYTPVLYSNGSNYYDVNNTSSFSEQQFFNNNTTPQPGEILILAPHREYLIKPGGTDKPIYYLTDTFIKVNKTDCNGNINKVPLEQATQLLIKYPTNSAYTKYTILYPPSEKPDYFLYQIGDNEVNEFGVNIDSEIKNYKVSASRDTPSFTISPGDTSAILSLTESIDTQGILIEPSGTLKLNNTPNIYLDLSCSLSLNSNLNGNQNTIALIKNGDVLEENAGSTVLSSTFSIDSGLNTVLFTGSFTGVNTDEFYLRIFNDSSPSDTGTTTFNSIEYLITQSTAPQYENVCDSFIIEPYITLPNYYYTDFNPLINNFVEPRPGTLYQDIDYSSGITEPVNFDLLISGSAVKANIPDSNYTLKRSIIPRYDGSRSTSQNINKWTSGDTGTYGKSPTLESLKTVIAYCDWLGGWPPERMNASTAHVLYLIDADGNIGVPNTSENSLPNVQGSFQTGEKFRISSRTIGSGEADQFRTVIRGGQRIEPIIYTQSGSQPGAQWPNIELTDIKPSAGGTTVNVQNNGSLVIQIGDGGNTPWYNMNARLRLGSGPKNSNLITTLFGVAGYNNINYSYYEVPQDVIDDNITLKFRVRDVSLKFTAKAGSFGTNKHRIPPVQIRIGFILKRNNDTVALFRTSSPEGGEGTGPNYFQVGTTNSEVEDWYSSFKIVELQRNNLLIGATEMTCEVPASQLSVGDQLSIEYQVENVVNATAPDANNYGIKILGGGYAITQEPFPTSPIVVSTGSISEIWGYYNPNTHKNVITSSDAVSESLGALYGDSNIRMKDVANSGFNPIALPWSIKYGDEFRFEGVESETYMVGKVYGPNEGSGSRVSQTGSIEVHFDRNLPTGSNISNFNLDHFLIRRYIDDPSQIIFEGFKPDNSQGPFILTPEYSTKDLNLNIDDVITNLKERGLITGEEGS